MLSKLTNANLINRSTQHKQISLNAVNNLNLIYLYWSNRFEDEKNNFFFFDYDLDNTLLFYLIEIILKSWTFIIYFYRLLIVICFKCD